MSDYRLTHLTDSTLLGNLATLVATDRSTTAALLAHIAEVDARRLYLPAAYASMFAYCVGELRLSEDAAYKRIRAARTALQFPRLFEDIAAGRLHLAAVCLLTPHITAENVDELVAAATHRRRNEIETILAGRFAPAEGSGLAAIRAKVIAVRAVARPVALAPEQLDRSALFLSAPTREGSGVPLLPADATPACAESLAPGPVVLHVPGPPTAPTSPRFIVRIPIEEATHAKLRRAQALLGHSVPSGDLAQVFERALDALIATLEKRKIATTDRPRPAWPTESAQPAAPRSRLVPAAIRRAVWKRDGGQCTFTSAVGRRCAARRALEFDHVVPFARGGEATVEGLRLRCRAHNQFEAERAFGKEFMRRKRERPAAVPQSVHDRSAAGTRIPSLPPPVKAPA